MQLLDRTDGRRAFRYGSGLLLFWSISFIQFALRNNVLNQGLQTAPRGPNPDPKTISSSCKDILSIVIKYHETFFVLEECKISRIKSHYVRCPALANVALWQKSLGIPVLNNRTVPYHVICSGNYVKQLATLLTTTFPDVQYNAVRTVLPQKKRVIILSTADRIWCRQHGGK